MTHNDILQCEEAARRIVQCYRQAFPIEAVGFDIGGGSSNQSSNFSRVGTSQQERQYALPANLSQLIEQAFLGSQVSSTLSANETAALQGLLARVIGDVPGLSTLQGIQGLDPTTFSGSNALQTIAARNPYSQDYENSTRDLYQRSFDTARAGAQSGPGNVRGGQARAGFDMADVGTQESINRFREIRGQQDKEAGVVQGAVGLANTIEGMRRGSQMQATGQRMAGEQGRGEQTLGAAGQVGRLRGNNTQNLNMAGEFLGKPKQITTDNLSGEGQQIQNTSQWGAGLTCCFIFLESFNGKLPACVRRGRDEFGSPARILGYRWVASWLVPGMRVSKTWRWLTNCFLVQPFIIHGEHYYKEVPSVLGWLLKPYCVAWLNLFGLIGRVKGVYDRRRIAVT